MSGFKALNIESDDDSDIEVDDTKEIQIEEALKLYQNALKYHAEGPASFDQAAEAYQQLFDSDIFKYPESQTELQRIELYGPLPESDELWYDLEPGTVTGPVSLEGGPSTLPQILHLSHKNYAQFKLEALSARFHEFHFTLNQILADAKSALDHFVHALDKDDTDLELWRRTASVGEMLDSKRVARFCLESVMDGDDEALGGILSLPGLEESLAGEQLRDLVFQLQDQLSLLQSPLSTSKRKIFSKLLKQQLHPYENIIHQESLLKEHQDTSLAQARPERVILKAPASWADLGDSLLRQLMAEQHGTASTAPALAVAFDLSDVSQPVPQVIEAPPAPNATKAPPLAIKTAFPRSLEDQFPGLDHGRPTAQPQIASADESMQVGSNTPTGPDVTMADSPTITLPSRKRSGDAAGLNDGADEGRIKSRRTRARESNADTGDSRQAIIDANARWELEQQLQEFQAADDWMFETVGSLFERIGIVGFDASRHIRQEMTTSADSTPSAEPSKGTQDLKVARSDIQGFVDKYSEQLAHLLLHGGENLDLGQSQSLAGAGGMFAGGGGSKGSSKLPPIPNDGLHQFLQNINEHHYLTQEAAWVFVGALLRPGTLVPESTTYASYQWPESLKTMVVRTLVNFDEPIYNQAIADLEAWKTNLDISMGDESELGLAEVIETIFELHLDIYSLIKQPNSGVEADIITSQGDRLQRWSDVAREAMHFRAVCTGTPSLEDNLNLRFLWATTSTIGTSDEVSQDHVIECMNDLRAILTSAGEPTIQLPNNAIMPELSLPALDREISKLTTKDFFLKITSENAQDAASVIESLEPLLEALESARTSSSTQSLQVSGDLSLNEVPPELLRFLENSNISVRLLLWQRLRDAYSTIEYQPMMVYCYFRMIRMVLDELKSADITSMAQAERQVTVLKCVRLLHDTVKKLYGIIHTIPNALECIDDAGLKLAVNGFGEVLQLLQVFNVAEDSLRIGQTQAPSLPNGLPVPSFKAVTDMVHEMQIQIWMMLYSLFKEAMSQNADQYPTPLEDRFDFLRTVHRSLGLRGICGSYDRVFVRMLKEEFLQMQRVEGYESEQAQVLYDLHRLNCFLDPTYELIEHKCTADAFMDRTMCFQAVDLLLLQASKLSIKDLIKHPIKDTIDKVHGSLPRKKPTEAVLRNRDIYRAYLRSPIDRLDLYDCLEGRGNQLPLTSIPRDDALLASKGWYFLMGQMALTRFRSVKRTGPTATEDVDIAIAFFNQALEYTGDHWETWFRLGQANDTKLEESVWTSEKLNSSMAEIVNLQRTAIHCYKTALALAYRSADLGFETSSKITELCYDFANRLYSSAREPFGMRAFEVEENERFVSTMAGVGREKSFQALTAYQAIKVASVLYKRALPGKSDSWMVHCMIGKCLWKLHNAPENARPRSKREPATQVLQALVRTLDLLPEKDRKGDGKKEPVLEPHYKMVTTVHKLLTQSRTINLEQAKETLKHTHYATKDTFPETMDEWTSYILGVLRNLRTADKSNWYHRMIYRCAQIVYDDEKDDSMGGQNLGAMGATHELQNLFTKTMVLQVWRPESERAGRHFVYTTRYTRFLMKILRQLKDRAGLEQLARRVRRRPHDLFEHSQLWQDICTAYLSLLREYAELRDGLETSTFSNIAHEDFLARKEPLEKWMQAQDSGNVPALDVLREVQELKKINQSLMKPGAIDDLIGDAYAQLFNTVGKSLVEEERRIKQEEDAKREAEKPPPQVVSPPRNPMMSLTHLMNVDGSSDAPPSAAGPPPPASTTAALGTPQPTEGPQPKRKNGVGRREVRTCAESCFQKAKSQSTSESAAQKIATAPRMQVLIERDRPMLSGEASVETSAPGSIHSDADDESELSELEEADDEAEDDEPVEKQQDQLPRPIFPGLAVSNPDSRDDSFETAEEDPSGQVDGPEDVEMQHGAEAAGEADN